MGGPSSTQDEIYVKLLFTEVTGHHVDMINGTVPLSSVTFRWSNLYNRQSYTGGVSWCDISSSSPSLLTEVSWSNFYGPQYFMYDDSWVGVIFIIYLFALIILLAMIVAMAWWIKSVSKEQLAMMRRMQQGQANGG